MTEKKKGYIAMSLRGVLVCVLAFLGAFFPFNKLERLKD